MGNRTESGWPYTETQVVVTAEQMQRIEASMFAAGMPVAALMEKVAGRVAQWIITQYPRDRFSLVGFIIGPGHNGGDALVVARELYLQGYEVLLWCPFSQIKELTAQHKAYLDFLGIHGTNIGNDLEFCDLIVDGGFGIGLTRSLAGEFANTLEMINRWQIPVVSIDIPSGLETDSGNVLGVAIHARHTLCLGLWKRGLWQDQALPWVGSAHLIPFGIPPQTLQSVLADSLPPQLISPQVALANLPLARSQTAHKYTAGHCLLIAGSRQYAGAALLSGMGAIASGVGMLTLVVPESLKLIVTSQLPEALVLGVAETAAGAIASLPSDLDWSKYDAVACGPGLTFACLDPVMEQVMAGDRPLVLDADGLNWLAQNDPVNTLQQRSAPTLLTPHLGEFRRLFPTALEQAPTPSAAAQQAAAAAQCTLILKGAISAIAHADGQLWFNPESTPALSRGGSGDVLTGLVTGLAAQHFRQAPASPTGFLPVAIAAVWWHAQTGRAVAADRTLLGCPPSLLAQHLNPVLAGFL